MIKLDSNLPPLTLPSASSLDPMPARRLMVLIPGVETDYTPAIHRVWELAHGFKSDVLFLGLCREASEEPKLRRALITMSALVHDGRVSSEVKVEIGNDWLKVVKSNRRDGDLIVCFADHRTGLKQKPLGQILESKLNAAVYILSGFDSPDRQGAGWFSTLLLWSGFAITIIGFFFLEANLDRALRGWVHTVVLVLTVLVEFWLVWVWNSLFS